MEVLTWIGIVFCVSQSATFSGLNLALFGISRLRLEVEVANGNEAAARLQSMRKDSNFLLTTILWGNVGANCLLTLLADSVMAGLAGFLFSTFAITLLGEICPQAYFSRNALRMASTLAPVLRFYQILLYPIAKPSALALDSWLGLEPIQYYPERDLRALLRQHVSADESEIDRIEGLGAINFLTLDDIHISEEGEAIDPRSVLSMPIEKDQIVFPEIHPVPQDPFIQQIQSSGKKWVILTDPEGTPRLALDSDGFIRGALFREPDFNPFHYCHRPILVEDRALKFGSILPQLRVQALHGEDDVIDNDIILLWGDHKRVVTGSDILGRLLRGISRISRASANKSGAIPKVEAILQSPSLELEDLEKKD